MAQRLIDADQMAVDESEAYMSAQVQITDDLKWLVNFAAHSKIQRLIADTPTVDAEVVVRCKECEHAERYERTDGTAGYYCGHPQNTFVYGDRWDRVFKPAKEADDFCSSGERKEGVEC
jgi:hypothetical protein